MSVQLELMTNLCPPKREQCWRRALSMTPGDQELQLLVARLVIRVLFDRGVEPCWR
jgi:hypothetical protein